MTNADESLVATSKQSSSSNIHGKSMKIIGDDVDDGEVKKRSQK